jgi:hypothetical protein
MPNKSVIATADNASSSLRSGRLISAVPHIKRYGKKSMIDRAARDKVIATFEAYLDDRITAFEFDDRLQDIDSEDRTVNEVVHAAWFHYDDCKDHKVHLSKPEWDYFQRLLLILRSDAELSSSEKRRWSWDHAIAWR